jgi:hypothetical protein
MATSLPYVLPGSGIKLIKILYYSKQTGYSSKLQEFLKGL